jgi:hypothetical protein
MNKKTASPLAGSSGTVSLGGELTVHRLGFGAMRITGDGIWGPPRDPASVLAVLRRATELARIIHGFLKSAEKLLWIAKHLQSEYQMLNFVQAATTDRRDL